jgi:thymidylate synthase (FAD)
MTTNTEQLPLLDHGYIQFIESWGSDERIVEAARMSTGKEFRVWGPLKCDKCMDPSTLIALGYVFVDGVSVTCPKCKGEKSVPGDEKLLRYLWENKHGTPFEMGGLVIEVKAPIFVFREWHRHRTQSYNEMSARYTPLPDENYIPTVERLMINSKTNKQAGTVAGAAELTEEGATHFRGWLIDMYTGQESLYQSALKMGVPKELARIHLPVGRYSRMRASANLRNWLAFLTLRMATDAQWEIRQYANAVGELIKQAFPRTWELFLGETK